MKVVHFDVEMFHDMTELYNEPLLFIYQYLSNSVMNCNQLTNLETSKLSIKVFIETYMVKNLEGALSLKIEKEQYTIPKLEDFSSFKDVFQEGILTLPSIDNPKIFGLKNNEEIIANYEISKSSFKFLTLNFTEARLDELDERLLSRVQTTEFQTLIRKSPSELEDLAQTSFIDYAISIVSKYEQRMDSARDSVKVISEITQALNFKIFEQIAQAITQLEQPEINDTHSPERSSKGQLPVFSKKNDQDAMSAKSSTGGVGLQFKEKEESQSLKSNENSKNKLLVFKAKFSSSFLKVELNSMKKLADFIVRDLNIVKMQMLGDPIFRMNQKNKSMLAGFSCNEVPEEWKYKLLSLNISQENLTKFFRSLLLKLDQLFNLSVKLKGDLPPIIPVNRLLDPESFFMNLLYMNSKFRNLSLYNCAFTLRSCKDRGFKETQSTIKITGFSVRGGSIDPVNGELVEELPREFNSLMGPLFLDIIETDCSESAIELEPAHFAFLMKNAKATTEKSLKSEFYKNYRKEVTNPPSLILSEQKQGGAQSQVALKREMTMRIRRQLTMEIESETVKYPVRIPVQLSYRPSGSQITRADFYLYCYSALPQIHWINKGTVVTLVDTEQ